jgi:hypothetical protein
MVGNQPDVNLPSFRHPPDQHPKSDANRECRCDSFHRVPLQSLRGVIKKLFCRIAALLSDTPGGFNAVLKSIGYSGSRPGSLARCFGDLVARFIQH